MKVQHIQILVAIADAGSLRGAAEILGKSQDEFGLASSVWSEDTDRAVSIARQIEAGYSFINAHGPSAQDGNRPFGGFKKSGIGRNVGYEGITQFQGYHSISGSPGSLL